MRDRKERTIREFNLFENTNNTVIKFAADSKVSGLGSNQNQKL